MRGTIALALLSWLAVVSSASGCSLFEQTRGGAFSFDLPAVAFKFDPAAPQWWPSPPHGVPYAVCAGPEAQVSDCCHLSAPAVDCQEYPLSCDDDGMCALAFDYDAVARVDLGASVPELQNRRGTVLAQADLAATTTEASGPGISLLRAASLYAAPDGATSAGAAGAVFLADVPLAEGEGQVDLAADAQIALSSFLVDFNTPFVLILSSHVVVEGAVGAKDVTTIEVAGQVSASF